MNPHPPPQQRFKPMQGDTFSQVYNNLCTKHSPGVNLSELINYGSDMTGNGDFSLKVNIRTTIY